MFHLVLIDIACSDMIFFFLKQFCRIFHAISVSCVNFKFITEKKNSLQFIFYLERQQLRSLAHQVISALPNTPEH